MSHVQSASGPTKKGKPASAAGGKAKKATDGKENVESELSVSFSPLICSPNYMQVMSLGKKKKQKNIKCIYAIGNCLQ